jgi:hypothetical protein
MVGGLVATRRRWSGRRAAPLILQAAKAVPRNNASATSTAEPASRE